MVSFYYPRLMPCYHLSGIDGKLRNYVAAGVYQHDFSVQKAAIVIVFLIFLRRFACSASTNRKSEKQYFKYKDIK